MKHYYLRAGRIRLLKPEADVVGYETKHPDAKKVCAPPSFSCMEKWVDDGVAKATDGCRVEPDGQCSHGHESYLKVLGYI